MYKAVIIDDESLFLNYLEEQVPWENYNVQIMRTFTSARMALSYMAECENMIDIILTDIKMPDMMGTELINKIPQSLKERAYIVALSGYEDYQLVREAFLNGASDYILKVAVNTQEFEKTMEQMRGYLDARSDIPVQSNGTIGEQGKLVESIREYIMDNLSQPLALNDLAKHFGFSPGYLSQLFSKMSGMTLVDYVINARVQKAQQMLRETGKSVTEIAYDVGFNSPEHFSRTFKKTTGISPREFRNVDNKP